MIDRSHTVRAHLLALLGALGVAAAALPGLAGDTRLSGVVNVNTATAEELQLLPGIGEARARAVVELRKSRGGFKSVDELVDVQGIGETGLERLRPFLSLEGKTTARLQ